MILRRSLRLSAAKSEDVKPTTKLEGKKQDSSPPKTEDLPKRKASIDTSQLRESELLSIQPTTPKKSHSKSSNKPPVTPNLVPVAGTISDVKVTSPPTIKRLRKVDPHSTNAPLQTPGGSRVLKTWSTDVTVNDDVLTTENLLEKACNHICKVDPSLKPLIDKHTCQMFTPEGLAERVDPFVELCSSIISQQVTGAAARSIKNKFIGLFPNSKGIGANLFPSPVEVAAAKLEFTRTAGLSQRKAEYIQGLAEKFASGELSAEMLIEASDEELLQKLIAVRGLGRWSVEMFATFALKRVDIFSTGDLGVQKGMAVYKGRDVNKLRSKGGKWKYMSEQEMLDIANRFAPYRSLFMWYMWKIADVKTDALEV